MAEEGENRSPELEVISQSREEGVVMEDSMIGSPSNMQDGFTGPNAIADAGIRQPNGTKQNLVKHRLQCDHESVLVVRGVQLYGGFPWAQRLIFLNNRCSCLCFYFVLILLKDSRLDTE